MSDIAIRVENLGKRYRYGGVAPLSDSLRADIVGWVKGLLRQQRQHGSTTPPHHESLREVHAHRLDADPRYFWALRDIGLTVNKGEVVGIIGRNGAGKSTLLKILSRITPPTTGRITYHGRIASLLEVGTGFHRELTGRENIFLNGSILGMKRGEIAKRFDEIVAFSEVEKFIDTPVKFYSSGMYVRLAFAVAAHLEPEILIVDEVLAVGDTAFQNKCLGKIGEVSRGGATVLLVSHNMGSIQQLAQRCVLVQEGKVRLDGKPAEAVALYLGLMSGAPVATNVFANPEFQIKRIQVDPDSTNQGFNKPLVIDAAVCVTVPLRGVSFGLGFVNSLGCRVLTGEKTVEDLPTGEHLLRFTIHDPRLPPGRYQLCFGVDSHGQNIVYRDNLLSFEISLANVVHPYLASKRDKIGVFAACDCQVLSQRQSSLPARSNTQDG